MQTVHLKWFFKISILGSNFTDSDKGKLDLEPKLFHFTISQQIMMQAIQWNTFGETGSSTYVALKINFEGHISSNVWSSTLTTSTNYSNLNKVKLTM